MIPRIQSAGGSFIGAGRYYLHDKQPEAERAGRSIPNHLKPKTDERVWFTETRNCFATDPERALIEMWKTAEDQAYLKQQAGVRKSGRKCEDPVKTLSLAWHKDDKPTPEHMVAAADAYLKHMGWDQHQAVYVGHRDTEHRHIHIILNRVHPETGRTLDDYKERVRSQEWALQYEKEHGKVWCQQREVNAAIRAEWREAKTRPAHEAAPGLPQPANTHLPHNVVMFTRPLERQYQAAEKSREDLDKLERDLLKARQRAERKAYFKDGKKLFKATRHAVYDEVRKEHAPEWRQYYKDRKATENEAEAWSSTAVGRALYFARQGKWEEARHAFADKDSVREAAAEALDARKADIKQRQTDELRARQQEACDALREAREQDYRALLQRQRDERAALAAAIAAGIALEDRPLGAQILAARAGNQNLQLDGKLPPPGNVNSPPPEQLQAKAGDAFSAEHQGPHAGPSASANEPLHQYADRPANGHGETRTTSVPEAPEPFKQTPDLAAGAIGAVAAYLADQLGELLAPTPPELRQARAKEEARREADKPAPEPKPSPYARQIEAALRAAEQEREEKRSRDYWTERERGRDWGRDR